MTRLGVALSGAVLLSGCARIEQALKPSPSASASVAALQAPAPTAAGAVAEPLASAAIAAPLASASSAAEPSVSATASSVSAVAPPPSLDPNKFYELYPGSTVPQPPALAPAAATALLKRFFPKFMPPGKECPDEWLPGTRSMDEARKAGMFSPEITAALVGSFTRRGAPEHLLHVRLHECTGSHAEGFGTSRLIIVEGARTIMNAEDSGLTSFGVAADVDGDGILEFTRTFSDTHQGLETRGLLLSSAKGGRLSEVRDFGQENIPCNAGVEMVGADAKMETFRVLFKQAATPQYRKLDQQAPCFTAEMLAAQQAEAATGNAAAAGSAAPDARQFAGTYTLSDGPNENTIKLVPRGEKLRVAYDLSHNGPVPATGAAQGTATISGALATFKDGECTIVMELVPGDRLKVTSRDSSACPFGAQTRVEGTYGKAMSRKGKGKKSAKR